MKLHAFYLRGTLTGHGDKALILGMAGGRVGYLPKARWLYSFRLYLVFFRVEVVWQVGVIEQ